MKSAGWLRFLCYSSLLTTTVGLKSWIPRTNLDDRKNWDILDVPKKCDDITFAVTSGLSLLWSFRDLLVTGLQLPFSGSLILEKDITIHFKDKNKCPGGREIVYKRDEWKGWLDPDNWLSNQHEMWIPHAQRIPCTEESVKFPPGNTFAVELPTIMVPVGKIFLEREEYDGDDWADFLNTERGKSQFRSEKVAQVPWLHDIGCTGQRSCSCGKNAYVFHDRMYKTVPTTLLHQAVCLYGKKSCGEPQCYSPVVPEGHCCGVCGAVINIRDHSASDSFLKKIREKVKKKIESVDKVEYYVGRTLDDNIQVAIVSELPDRADEALALASLIKDDLAADLGSLVSAKFSGMSYSGNFLSSTTGIIFGTLFAVLAFFASLYFVYIVLPEKNIITGEHPFRFARFKNTLHEVGSEEKLEIGTEEALPCVDSQGFQNPTFSTEDGPTTETSKPEPEIDRSNDTDIGRQEYENPIYHEMEKTKDLNFFESRNEEKEDEEEEDTFSEIEL